MSSSTYKTKKTSHSPDDHLADLRDDPREWQDRLVLPVGSLVDANGILNEAATYNGQEMRPTVQGEIAAKKDYDWSKDPTIGNRRRGQTLVQQERELALEREMGRYRERALAAEAAGIDRERSSRLVTTEERRQARADFDERAALAAGEDPTAPDPREQLSQEELAAVNLQAYRMDERMPHGPGVAMLSRRLAERVVKGQPVTEAVLDLTDEIYKEPGMIQPITTVDPWSGDASIEGVVTRLFEPASTSQQQVGYVEDDTGSIKVTIWEKSQQSIILHEGDRVRIRYGKPGSYKGQRTLAVVWESIVTVLEKGDGPGPVHGIRYQADWSNGTDGQKLGACTAPSMTDRRSKPVPRSEAGRFRGEERWIFPSEACPEWFREQENVGIYDPDE